MIITTICTHPGFAAFINHTIIQDIIAPTIPICIGITTTLSFSVQVFILPIRSLTRMYPGATITGARAGTSDGTAGQVCISITAGDGRTPGTGATMATIRTFHPFTITPGHAIPTAGA